MLKRLGFHMLDSFIYHLVRGDVRFQIYGFKLTPWCRYNPGTTAEVDYVNFFAGWLFVQCRWTHV